MTSPSFAAVLRRAQHGDAAAFESLYEQYQPLVHRYLRTDRRCDADDVAGDVWLSVIRSLATFTGDEAAFRGWLFTIARHRRIDGARSAQRRRTVPLDDVDASDSLTAAPDTLDEVIERESTSRTLTAVSQLPPDQAECVYLRFVAGLDVAAVAILMSRSEGAIRVLSHRGLRRLSVVVERPGIEV